MDIALIATAGLMGLAGAPHCAAMCSAPCGAVARRCAGEHTRAALVGLLGGRQLGYMVAGAAAAGGVAVFAALGELAPALRPLWAAVHVAVLGMGLWMLSTGALPAWLGRLRPPVTVAAAGWQPVAGPKHMPMAPLRAGAIGTLWVAMPCGLLQSALLVAALANTPWHAAAAMGAFAATSSLGLSAVPALWSRLPAGERAVGWAVRGAGALLVAASGWALGHGLWQRIAALCAVP